MDPLRAAQLALELMEKHGLPARGWQFQMSNRSKKLCGRCEHTPKNIILFRSYVTLNREELIRDTILHEIAHALVGRGHGHDQTWALKCREVGAMPIRCKSIEQHGLVMFESDWYTICSKCGMKHSCIRRPRFRGVNYFHTPCGKTAYIRWFYKGMEYDNRGVAVPATPLPAMLPKAADQPKVVVIKARPSQEQVNELWERLNKLEGKV